LLVYLFTVFTTLFEQSCLPLQIDQQKSAQLSAFCRIFAASGKFCCPYRAEPRTFDAILEDLTTLNTQGQLPDLLSFGRVRDHDSEDENPNKEWRVAG
jgi:hypothetical protein